MKPDHLYAVILAGGCSKRLWPLSRQQKPKQFLSFDNQKTLLDYTIDRLVNVVPDTNIWISTTQEYEEMASSYLSAHKVNVITEPSSRNTAPSILLACMNLIQHDPEAVVFFVPVDSFIPDEEKELFINDIQIALDFANKFECIVLLGVKPSYSAVGYGYIEYCCAKGMRRPCKVKRFHEKPSLERAKAYVNKSNMLWNSGIVCAQVQVLIDEFKKEAPDIYNGVKAYIQKTADYEQVRAESVDYAVIEKSKCIYVLPVEFSWCDVGNIATFVSLKNRHTDITTNCISIKSNNNVIEVSDNTLVVLVGVDDLCIVKTADVLLVLKKDHADQVRDIVEQLRQQGQKGYL